MNNYAGQSRRSAVNVLVDQLKHEKTTLDQVGSDERPLFFFTPTNQTKNAHYSFEGSSELPRRRFVPSDESLGMNLHGRSTFASHP